ncbi:MAG: hypothetical protein U9N85_07210 [Bacteroidota bacterium]|nr:hypothetical protein [Bacteroidota bacterium]
MKRKLYTKQEVIKFISEGKKMVLSASEKMLDVLPKGNWIGGTSPYFMDTDVGKFTEEKIFVDDLTHIATDFKIEKYDKDNIKNIAINSFKNGFTVLIIPGESDTHFEFGVNSMTYDKIFNNPVVGFIAGFDLDRIGELSPKVYNGQENEKILNDGVAIHIKLPDNKVARAEILNLDTINRNSPEIKFPTTSFTQSECTINGDKANITDYLSKIEYKEGLPIIADYNGALINRDIKVIDKKKKEVTFFSPVFHDEIYYLANVIDNYHELFGKKLKTESLNIPYSVICVSYYLLGNLENKKIQAEGVFAFGEIAFQLLNQTLVFLEIDEV